MTGAPRQDKEKPPKPPRKPKGLAGWVAAVAFVLSCAGCGRTKPAIGPAGGDFSDAGLDATSDGGRSAIAFPGAVGWAAATSGGRGGQILRVTTLAGAGAGSLRAALLTPGPRIIVFEVGGVIDLATQRLNVTVPDVTIAGQTAPSPGITLIKGGIQISTHDVVLQHIRVRPGDVGGAPMSGWETDSISTYGAAYNVIVDHCSATWGTDENLSASGPRFQGATPDDWRAATSHTITFSNNIVAEGLSQSTHLEGEHSKGGLIHDNVTRMALVGNLYFSNMDRHPLFKGGARGIVVNNYIANPGRWAMMYALNMDEWGTNPFETGQMSIVGNVFTYGPSTPAGVPLLRASGAGPVEAYFADNIAKTVAGEDVPLVGGSSAARVTSVADAPIWPESSWTVMPAANVSEYVRANVGARPWDRDAIDTRIVEQALGGQGAIINSQDEVGGYPTVEPTAAPFIPEEWDLRYMIRKPAE